MGGSSVHNGKLFVVVCKFLTAPLSIFFTVQVVQHIFLMMGHACCDAEDQLLVSHFLNGPVAGCADYKQTR